MSEIATELVLFPIAVVFYGSGLLLWPIRRWLHRKRSVRGRSLGFVCLGQLVAFSAIAVLAVARPGMLEHPYYWCILLIELNILYTIVGVIAWLRDSRYEHRLDANVSA